MTIVELESELLHGYVCLGFEEVQAEFIRNFEQRNEVRAACTIFYRGQKVVVL